jgi:hypothetical protein
VIAVPVWVRLRPVKGVLPPSLRLPSSSFHSGFPRLTIDVAKTDEHP